MSLVTSNDGRIVVKTPKISEDQQARLIPSKDRLVIMPSESTYLEAIQKSVDELYSVRKNISRENWIVR